MIDLLNSKKKYEQNRKYKSLLSIINCYLSSTYIFVLEIISFYGCPLLKKERQQTKICNS